MSIQVKVTARKSSYKGREYLTYYVNIPSAFAKLLKVRKDDILNCTIADVNINGKTVKALIYYKD